MTGSMLKFPGHEVSAFSLLERHIKAEIVQTLLRIHQAI